MNTHTTLHETILEWLAAEAPTWLAEEYLKAVFLGALPDLLKRAELELRFRTVMQGHQAEEPLPRPTRVGVTDGVGGALDFLWHGLGLILVGQAEVPASFAVPSAAAGLAARGLARQEATARCNGTVVSAPVRDEYLFAATAAAAAVLCWADPIAAGLSGRTPPAPTPRLAAAN